MILRGRGRHETVIHRTAGFRVIAALAVVACTVAGGGGRAAAAGSGPSHPASAAPADRPLWPSLRPPQAHGWEGLAHDTAAGSTSGAGAYRPAGGPAGQTIAVGAGPYGVAVDQATDTAYVVANGTVSVINAATCNATVTSGCGQTPPTVTALTQAGPVDAVDQATDTVYVANLGSDTVSVINGATCNATVTTGCSQIPATLTVGEGPDGIAVDQATDTVYVANDGPGGNNSGDTVSVVNGATCNGQVTSGCGQTPAAVTVGFAPAVPAVDEATNTVYVPNSNFGGAGSVSVIDGATCDAVNQSGCASTPPTVSLGFNTAPASVAVDQATNTVYVTSDLPNNTGTTLGLVDVIDGAACDATVTFGCGQAPRTVTVGSIPIAVTVDPVTQSVFVVDQEDSAVSVIDGAICNAVNTAGCAQRPPEVGTGFDPGYLGIDAATNTVYVANQNENTVSVLDGAACTLTQQSGCRHPAPTTVVGTGPQGIAVNQLTDTVYVGNQNDNDLTVIDGAICNASMRSGCGRAWPTVATGSFPQAVAVDQVTDTIYVANLNDNTVSVINGATCNARVTSGCGQSPPTVSVGSEPDGIAVDQVTDTIYVANAGDNTVSVIDGAACNATVTSGCGQSPLVIEVGNSPIAVAVDQVTDTAYVANAGDNTVSVIDGAACNATVTSGCGQSSSVIAVGNAPDAVAVNQVTDTIYVTTGLFEEFTPSAAMYVIDGATCNSAISSGCDQTPATVVTGGFSYGVAVNQATDTVFADSIIDSDLEAFAGATCDASQHAGCGQTPASVPVGGWPANLAVNPATGTIYVPDNVDGQVSIVAVPEGRPL
jgi:YVTN family beta-propeller protein